MYEPPKYFWNNTEISDFCNIVQPFREGLATNVITGYPDLETAVKLWDNFAEPRNFEFNTEIYKNRIQTYNKEKNKFEPNVEGAKSRTFAYTMIDSKHHQIYRINPNSEEEAGPAIKYASACQLLETLGEDCVRLSYWALAPNTTRFRMVDPEYKENNYAVRVVVPISVPASGVSLYLNPRGDCPRGAASSDFKEICAYDTQRFPEIENKSDEWLILLWIDVARSKLGLDSGETILNKFYHLY